MPERWWLEPRFFDAVADWHQPVGSIFENEPAPTAKGVMCPAVRVTDGDRMIARYVGFTDASNAGSEWRHGLSWADLFWRAHRFVNLTAT